MHRFLAPHNCPIPHTSLLATLAQRQQGKLPEFPFVAEQGLAGAVGWRAPRIRYQLE